MPAPNLTALYNFEGQFETAAQGILANVLIDAYKTNDPQVKLPVQHVAISFNLGPAIEGEFAQLPKPASWPVGAPPPQEYFRYNGTLEYRVQVPRDETDPTTEGVDTLFEQIRGKLREEMMQSVRPFNEVNLPYYKVSRVRPDGANNGENAEGNADRMFLRFVITFEIRKDAWPAWVEE